MRVDAILQGKANRIVAVAMATTIESAARLLKSDSIGAVVVKDTCGTEGEVVLGMLSERDIVRALAERGAAVLGMPVAAFMSRSVIACGPDDEATTVMDLMRKHQIRHLPVVDRDALIGVVSIRDVLGIRADSPEAPHVPSGAGLSGSMHR